MQLFYGVPEDIEKWMSLVTQVRWNFPGLETQEKLNEHRATVLKFMGKRQAICVKEENEITGVMLFSRGHNMICCLGVLPEYRRRGVASILMDEALANLDRTKEISVSTFRADDKKGLAPRALYEKYGFVADELIEEFDYPNQKFVLYPIGAERKARQLAVNQMVREISHILADCEPSIYMYGSSALNDFRLGWSDLDILVLTSKQITEEQAKTLVRLRQAKFPTLPEDIILYKILASSQQKPLYEGIETTLTDDVYHTIANNDLIQIMSNEATKWNGIKQMLSHFGVSPSEAVYFGDDNDDIEPIKNCGLGVAVSNAIPSVLDVADRVIDSNDMDGVAKFIEENLL